MRIGSLFSGIGGLELGLERAIPGAHTVFQVESDPYARRVLARHWPNARRYNDVRQVGAHNLEPIDILCGGFPCQDISVAGKQAGIDGERSGLWAEYARIIGELRPRYVVVENVAALRVRGMGSVLGDMASCGYDAIWDCIPAKSIGATHRRDRIFIIGWVANPMFHGLEGIEQAWTEARATVRSARHSWWGSESNVGRVADGVPRRVDRLRCLGNAVVPQVAEVVGRVVASIVGAV